jgi:hypothetical protein
VVQQALTSTYRETSGVQVVGRGPLSAPLAQIKRGIATRSTVSSSGETCRLRRKPGAFIFGVYPLTSFLRENGAEAVAVADIGTMFSRDNPLYAKLEAGL